MPVSNKDLDFSAFDEQISSEKPKEELVYDFSVFDNNVKKKASSQILPNISQDGELKSTTSTIPPVSEKPTDIISLALEKKKLNKDAFDQGMPTVSGGTGGGGVSVLPSWEKLSQANDINTKMVSDHGLEEKDINDIDIEMQDLPSAEVRSQWKNPDGTPNLTFTNEALSNLREQNYPRYLQYLNTAKVYDALRNVDKDLAKKYIGINNEGYALQAEDIYSGSRIKKNLKDRQDEIISKSDKLTDDQKQKLIDYNNQIYSANASANIDNEEKSKDYLSKKLSSSLAELDVTPTAENQYANKKLYEGEDIDNFPMESIEKLIDKSNPADVRAFDVYKYTRSFNDAVKQSPNIEEAAINYASGLDPVIAQQRIKLKEEGLDLPEQQKAEYVKQFLDDPRTVQLAAVDPKFKMSYVQAKNGFDINYPKYNVKRIAQTISQAREDRGMNNVLVNIPTESATRELVDDLVKEGKLSEADKIIYYKQIDPKVGVGQSILRGTVGIPFGAFTGVSPIPTPGVLENMLTGFHETTKGMARSIEDLPLYPIAPSNAYRLQSALTDDYGTLKVNLSKAHQISEGTGHLLGFTVPMIYGGLGLKAAGMTEGAAHLTNSALMFEGANRDLGLRLFPNDPVKRLAFTTLSTAGDMFLADLIPTKSIRKGISNVLKKDVAEITEKLLNKEITPAIAEKTLLQKTMSYLPKFAVENAKTAGTITGFGVYHKAVESLFGANDLSAADIAFEAVKEFKHNLLTTPILTMLSMKGKSDGRKVDSRILLEMASSPESYKTKILEFAQKSNEPKEVTEEKLRNLDNASAILKDLNKTNLTQSQKEKYFIYALSESALRDEASKTTDSTLKKKYLDEANAHSIVKENILSGRDQAKEFDKYEPVTEQEQRDIDRESENATKRSMGETEGEPEGQERETTIQTGTGAVRLGGTERRSAILEEINNVRNRILEINSARERGELTEDSYAGELKDLQAKETELKTQLESEVPEAEVPEGKAPKTYTQDNLDQISTEGLNKKQARIVGGIKNIVKAVANLAKGTGKTLSVTVHTSPESYAKAVVDAGGSRQDSNTKGFYLGTDGSAHINLGKASDETVAHEVFHFVLDFLKDKRPELVENIYKQLNSFAEGKSFVESNKRRYVGDVTQMKEAITDFIAHVADGSIVINPSNFAKVKKFIIDTLNKIGFDIKSFNIAEVKDAKELVNLAKLISEKFKTGEEIKSEEILDGIKENQTFQPIRNKGEVGEVSAAGRIDPSKINAAKVMDINPLQLSREEFKEVEVVDLPVRSLKDVLSEFDNKAIAINSDPSKVGKLKLFSGEEIFMYGGLNYPSIKKNVDENIGFSSTQIQKPKQVQKTIQELYPKTGKGLILITSQSPESIKGDAYGLEYVLSAIRILPKSILRSSDFKNDFFGKDIVAIKNDFGAGKYDNFIKKYGRADFTNDKIMDNMINDLLDGLGSNFVGRTSLVSNLLAGIVKKSSRVSTKDEPGYISVTPSKYIAKSLFDRFGLNQEKLFYDLGVNGIVDAFMKKGEWGFVTGGFTSDSNVDYMSIQNKGIVHPQFNAKFHGENPFILDGGYQIDKLFLPEEIIAQSGKPYTKKASLMVAASMYPKGEVVPTAEKTTENIVQFSREQNEKEDIVTAAVNVAPLYSTKVSSEAQAKLIHESPLYQNYKRENEKVASMFGLEVVSQEDGIGGYEFSNGQTVMEATTIVNVKGKFSDIVEYAAINGALTPEVQDATIAGMYVKKNSEFHNADKVEVKIDNTDAAMKAAKDAGFDRAGFTLVDGEISFFNVFFHPKESVKYKEQVQDFKKKVVTFVNKYKEYGGQIISKGTRAVRSEYIDNVRRREILDGITESTVPGGQGRAGIRDALATAKERNTRYTTWKYIDKSESAKEYRSLRQKQFDLAAEGKSLSDAERTRLSDLEKRISKLLTTTYATKSERGAYEQAKAEVDAIANDVAQLVEDGYRAEFPTKRPSRAAIKTVRWYDSQPNLLGDGARTNVIVNTDVDANFLYDELQKKFPSATGRTEKITTELGYPKRLIEIRTKNGKLAEVQVMTPQGYLAKDGIKHFPKDAKSKAEQSLKEVQDRLGWEIPDGAGHYFYEINRDVNVPKELRDQAAEVSNKYYDAFLNPESKLTDQEFRTDLEDFKSKVDAADKSKWDEGNDGKSPEELNKYLGEETKGKPQFSKVELPNGEKVTAKDTEEPEVINGFYSPVEKKVLSTKQNNLSATKWLNELGKTKDEVVYTGLKDFLESKRPDQQVTKQELLDFMKNNRIEVREVVKIGEGKAGFHKYQLTGEKENYKEVLITLPKVQERIPVSSIKEEVEYERKGYYIETDANGNNFAVKTPKTKFQSSHFEEPNIAVHLRMNTRTDAEGNKVLFLEEVQSDWGQKGKREGFADEEKENLSAKKQSLLNKYYDLDELKGDKRTNEVVSNMNSILNDIRTINEKLGLPKEDFRTIPTYGGDIAKAPFVTDTNAWTKLGLKYAIQHAIKEGADKIVWTTGEQQNERYDLSKSINRVDFIRVGEDRYKYEARGLDGKRIAYDDNGTTSLKEIEGMFGKDIAEKVKADKSGDLRLEGEGLKVGGKGMIGFYGSPEQGKEGVVGSVAKALVKELTGKEGKIGETDINGASQHSIEITPELKASAEKGMPQFSKEELPEEEPKRVGLSKAEITKQVEEFSMLPPARAEKITDAELDQMADDAIASGYDVGKLVDRLKADYGDWEYNPKTKSWEKKGEGVARVPANDLEITILNKYAAALNAEQTKNPSRETLQKYTETMEAARRALSITGATLRQARRSQALVDNLSNFLVDKEVAQGAPLTEDQLKEETAKYNELKKAKDELEAQLKIEREKNEKLIAEMGYNKAKAAKKKEVRKTDAEYKAERKASIEAAKEALRKLRSGEGGIASTIIPGARELMAIAPHVKDMMKSYAEQGIGKLEDVVNSIHAELKDVVEGLRKSDIIQIIAGRYDEPIKNTRNELAAKIRLLKREADLLLQLADAKKGVEKAKKEKNRSEEIKNNRRIEELKKAIAEAKKINKESREMDQEIEEAPEEPAVDQTTNEARLAKKQQLLEARILKLKEAIDNKQYLEEEKELPPLAMDRKTKDLIDKVAELENKIKEERIKDILSKESKAVKVYKKAMHILGLKRIIQTSVDLSVSFRQGATLLAPNNIGIWGKSFGSQLKGIFSQSNYNRMMYEIRHSEDYHEMLEDGIVFNDLETPNEDFSNANFIMKVPLIKEPLRSSQRAADAFLNTARYELYMKFKRNLESQGITRQSDPKVYKDAAKWAMNMTGRGNLIKSFEHSDAQKLLGNTFFGARLMASRFNMLNPVAYYKMSPEVRKQALTDITMWAGTTIAVAASLSQIPGVSVSLNPDDSDFLQVRYGSKVYDLSGGLSVYLRTYLRLIDALTSPLYRPKYMAKEKAEQAGKSFVKFFRNKLAPNTSYAVDAVFGKGDGTEFNPYDALKLYPMYIDDVVDSWEKEGGIVAMTSVLLPNIVGLGYGAYGKKGELETDLDKLIEHNAKATYKDYSGMKNYRKGGLPVTEDEFAEYAEKVDDKTKKYITELYNDGKYIVDDNNQIVKKKYSELTQDQVNRAIQSFKATTSNEVEKEMFGEPTGKQYISEKVKALKSRQLKGMEKKEYGEMKNFKEDSEGVPVTEKEYTKFTKNVDRLLTKDIDKLVKEGTDIIDDDYTVHHKDFDELTNDEIDNIIGRYSKDVESYVSKELFGQDYSIGTISKKVKGKLQKTVNLIDKIQRTNEYNISE